MFAAQLVHSLAYLQQMEIMHRDMKPQNIMLDENYNIKIIDFGEAKKVGEQSLDDSGSSECDSDISDEEERKHRGTLVGTLNYMSPEMIKNSVATLETDLWALGCIIFKMVTGYVPFPGTDLYGVKNLIINR